MQEIKKISI